MKKCIFHGTLVNFDRKIFAIDGGDLAPIAIKPAQKHIYAFRFETRICVEFIHDAIGSVREFIHGGVGNGLHVLDTISELDPVFGNFILKIYQDFKRL